MKTIDEWVRWLESHSAEPDVTAACTSGRARLLAERLLSGADLDESMAYAGIPRTALFCEAFIRAVERVQAYRYLYLTQKIYHSALTGDSASLRLAVQTAERALTGFSAKPAWRAFDLPRVYKGDVFLSPAYEPPKNRKR